MLIQLLQVSLSFGGAPILDGIDWVLEPGDRVALLGRNGAGKSTLLKLLAGELDPDGGRIMRSDGVRASRLVQEVPATLGQDVQSVVLGGLGPLGTDLAAFLRSAKLDQNEATTEQLDVLQNRIDMADGWTQLHQIEAVMDRLELEPGADFDRLSGGWKRRVMLARALAGNPNLLLLDEPTNHLDITQIEWLEQRIGLLPPSTAMVLISHDRRFLRRLATGCAELDRGALLTFPGGLDDFLARRDHAIAAEQRANAEFDRKLAEEERWIRQGVKARRTRNEGRVRALEAMRRERAERRQRSGNANLRLDMGSASGKLVIEAKDISFRVRDEPLFTSFSTTIQRGDKVGIIGPNGCGKTTLIRILLGETPPETGNVRQGTQLNVAYFDQLRAGLDQSLTPVDTVGQGRQSIQTTHGERHIISYLQDFLFTPQQSRTSIAKLSGGERNRLLLAQLFAKPSNLLVMDEPTNDLDIETLELLEELLVDYPGTLLLVSHDRDFLNAVVTSTIAFEGGGRVREYVGGYDDYLEQRADTPPTSRSKADSPSPRSKMQTPQRQRTTKLTFNEERERNQLPERIEALEAEQTALATQLADPTIYQREPDAVASTSERLRTVEAELATAYARWELLENRAEP